MLFSVFLLPAWWAALSPKSKVQGPKSNSTGDDLPSSFTHHASRITDPASRITRPPSFYRAGLWRLGLFIVRLAPTGLLKGFCVGVAAVYVRVRRQRVEVVVQNLLPVVGDRVAAEKAARRLHHNFAVKLVDLWRLESGVPVHDFLTDPSKLEIIQAARRRGRGIIFITLHLGNWEHGGQLLSQFDIPLTILTQAEPDDGLTALRTESRRRCGVETLVIGQDSFAFIEVIKRLQDGAALALALDRPPARGGVGVELFGRSFVAPAAAAELARASGCALIGVTIVRRPNGYAVNALPEFTYDRRALGNHEARRQLTQQILRAFEPAIRENIDQWYQFVPIWPQCESRTPA